MREITYADAIREAMSEEMRADPDVFLFGEDVGIYGGAFGVSKGMFQEFGAERVRDTPLSEHAITGCAAGAAMSGMRPIVEIMFSDFLTIALEQLANQAAKARFQFGGQFSVPMVLRTAGGSGTGAAEQHSQSLEAWVCHVPGLKVVIPSTPYDAKGLLKSAIRDPNPVVFIEQKLLYRSKGPVPEPAEQYSIPLGVADTKRPGRDLTIISWGRMVQRSLEAAGKLAAEGIEAEVIDIRSLVPLDTTCIIQSVKRTGRALIVHEAAQTAGYGGEIAAVIADSEAFFHLDAPIRRVAGLDVPIPYNPVLEANVVPTLDKVVAAARDLVK
jgi:acetoin:2,6-dichlorophenolindophenol oxidoreductase subunit beta